MPTTPITTLRLKEWIKEAIQKRTKNLSKWIEEACIEKLNRDGKT